MDESSHSNWRASALRKINILTTRHRSKKPTLTRVSLNKCCKCVQKTNVAQFQKALRNGNGNQILPSIIYVLWSFVEQRCISYKCYNYGKYEMLIRVDSPYAGQRSYLALGRKTIEKEKRKYSIILTQQPARDPNLLPLWIIQSCSGSTNIVWLDDYRMSNTRLLYIMKENVWQICLQSRK